MVIGPARARLVSYLEEAELLLQEDSSQDVRAMLEDLRLRVERVVALLEGQNVRWSKVISYAHDNKVARREEAETMRRGESVLTLST